MDETPAFDPAALIGGLAPLLDAVKSNPGLLSGALSLLSPGSGGVDRPGPPPPPPPRGRESDRRRLLSALSPYLSPERQRVLSTILPLLEAWESISPLLGGLRQAQRKE